MQSIIPFVNRSSVCPSSQPILDRQFSYEALVSAAVGTEILLLGKNWCHARDQRRRGSFQSISVVKRLNRVFLKDLDELVAGEKPLILAKGFSRGLTRRVLDDIENSMVVRANGHNDRIVTTQPRRKDEATRKWALAGQVDSAAHAQCISL